MPYVLRPAHHLLQLVIKRNLQSNVKKMSVTEAEKSFNKKISINAKKNAHNRRIYDLPRPLLDFINNESSDMSEEELKKVPHFRNILKTRRPKIEKEDFDARKVQIVSKLVQRGRLPDKPVTEFTTRYMNVLAHSMKQEIHPWDPIDFDESKARQYLIGRSTPDFVSLINMFGEITKKDPKFEPKTVFDFGAGIGTVTWAVSETWPEKCKELVNCDNSTPMLDLNKRVIETIRPDMPGLPSDIRFREFLPSSDVIKYDLVVCSRTLFEIGDMAARCRIADILWRKVSPNGYIVFAETGSIFGYSIMIEVRDYLLEMSQQEKEREMVSPIHVFAPCPHDSFCPRYDGKHFNKCCFPAKYFTGSRHASDHFSYVILQKKDRPSTKVFPRIISPVKGSGAIRSCYLCTKEGNAAHCIVSNSKPSKECTRLAKKMTWGDEFPVHYELQDAPPPAEEEDTQSDHEEN